MMRIVFIGCVKSSEAFLKTLLTVPQTEVVGIVTRKRSKFNADFVSLKDLAVEHNIPYFIFDSQVEDDMVAWVEEKKADIIYCFGWSYLLHESLIQTTRLGGIGYHPAMLPQNRGRHPVIWALALGLRETASTFFFLDKEADAGDIVSQEIVAIADDDDAGTLYEKLLKVGRSQLVSFTKALSDGTYRRIPQESSKANNWRKRGYRDGVIDWRMPSRGVYNLIRALTHPYIGACFRYGDEDIKVWKSEIVSEDILYPNLEPGRVLSVNASGIEIQCGIGVIRITDYESGGIQVERGECLP